jgi:tRNA-specific 2-thiouridylase
VKFGAFYEYLQEGGHGAAFDRIASGHYARVLRDGDGSQVRLALTPDAIKDQTYFLAHLSQPQLARTMFPLGPLTKVRPALHSGAGDWDMTVGTTIHRVG